MVGNVNGIVESMYAAENARTQQSAASGKTGNFSGYLDAALLNYRTGLFTQGLGGGFGNALYMNALSGQTWQSIVLKALKDELEKKEQSGHAEGADTQDREKSEVSAPRKPDWATIRVIERYRSPLQEDTQNNKGIQV
ncbi:MAG: hypothetical protein HFI83_00075 [Eubacterium sp.]|jgi:hypothetical protein|nr:hypothetical protein [Eubacterium sp.]